MLWGITAYVPAQSFRHYPTSQPADIVYNFPDIRRIAIKGSNLESFQNTWNTAMAGMRKQPEKGVLELSFSAR